LTKLEDVNLFESSPRVEVVDITVQATDYVRDTMRVVVRYLQPAVSLPPGVDDQPQRIDRHEPKRGTERASTTVAAATREAASASHARHRREHDRQRLHHLDRTRQEGGQEEQGDFFPDAFHRFSGASESDVAGSDWPWSAQSPAPTTARPGRARPDARAATSGSGCGDNASVTFAARGPLL